MSQVELFEDEEDEELDDSERELDFSQPYDPEDDDNVYGEFEADFEDERETVDDL